MSHALTSRQRHVSAAQAVDLGVLYTTISAGMLLVRRYLTGRGIDQDFADRYGSAFGRNAAKIYRAANGAEPRRAWSLVSGKWRRVNGYLASEADVLDEAFTTYKRTAEYVITETPADTNEVCGNQWKYGKDTCAREAGHIALHRNTKALEAWSFQWFDNEGTPAVEPSPVEIYNKEAGHFVAQFADITGETLRTIERAHGTEAAETFVRSQLADLATWKQVYDRYDQAMTSDATQAARDALEGLPWDDSRVQAFMNAERGENDHGQARDALNAAIVDWMYDLTGTVEIDDGPRPEPPVTAEGCRIPGCDGTWHYDDVCVRQLGEVQFQGEDVSLPAELVADETGPHIVAFAYNMTSLNIRREMRDQATAAKFTAQLRHLADAIDGAAALLPA